MISSESTTVYRGGGRRWLTRKAAGRAEARARIKERCECDDGDRVTPPAVCDYHQLDHLDRTRAITDRLGRWYERSMERQ